MAEALRAALRFLPAVKPLSVAGRRALVCRDQSVVLSLVHVANSERKQQAAVSGLAKFARTVLSYVGVGISTIAASQISGPATVQAKEISADCKSMAAAEMRAAWHRTAATCYLLHEDSKRTSKLGHPTSELSEPQTTIQDQQVSKFQSEPGKCDSFGLSDGWSAINSHYFVDKKLDFHFQMATDIENEAESQLKSLSEVAMDAGSTKLSDWETLGSSCASVLPIRQEKENANKADEVVGMNSKDEGKAKTGKVNGREAKASSFLEPKIHQVQQPLTPLARKFDHVNQAVSSGTSTWRHADKGELAALIAKKSLEDIENCDLPPALSPVAKGVLGKCDVSSSKKDDFLQISRSVDRNVLASILQGDEPARLETQPSPFTFRSLAPLDLSQVKRAASSKKECEHDYRPDSEATNWRSLVPEGNSELLGEALCRSQTRAREAEKRAAEAVMENEQLLKLFFREASISLTYKHWLKYLQAENSWLRLRAEDESGEEEAEHDFLNPFMAFQQLSNNRWKRCKKTSQEVVKFKKRKHSDHSAAMLGCTVGLAFALGVSFAGAGLLFGCTLGWILIAF